MKVFTTGLIAAATAAVILGTGLTASNVMAQDAAAAVKARSDLMKAQVGAYLRITKAEDAKATVDDAKLIQGDLKKLGDAALWPANSMTADSRAKAEIWQNMGDFNAKLAATQKEADTLVATAEKGNIEAVKTQAKAMFDSCNACHATYRGPAKTK